MTREEIHLIEFALLWQPYGGPSAEDVLVQFGLSMPRYYARIRQILTPVPHDSVEDVSFKNGTRQRLGSVPSEHPLGSNT